MSFGHEERHLWIRSATRNRALASYDRVLEEARGGPGRSVIVFCPDELAADWWGVRLSGESGVAEKSARVYRFPNGSQVRILLGHEWQVIRPVDRVFDGEDHAW